MVPMRIARFAWIVLVLGCGSRSTASSDAGASLPTVGSSDCDMQEGCVLCDDEMWHCGSEVFPGCPSDVDAGAACEGVPDGGMMTCVTCGGGGTGDDAGVTTGFEWQCTTFEPMPYWRGIAVPCRQ
jgi:hypothetical protein